jgi:carbonic anhydrase/SulP family sulfate permease
MSPLLKNKHTEYTAASIAKDLLAGVIVFLVAVPLCLGIAVASGAPPMAGLLAGIVGGLVIGPLSGSQTSVSGPAAGLTAIVLAQITNLGYEGFLLAVMIGGLLQIVLGAFKAGALSAFFPSSVIKGLLAAIGVILILKQFPHLLGHDTDPVGEMRFQQPDHQNTFSEFLLTMQELFSSNIQLGAVVIGVSSLIFLVVWDQIKYLKQSLIPAPLLVVIFGVVFKLIFDELGGAWVIEPSHLVQVPMASSIQEFVGFLQLPDFSQLTRGAVYIGAITVCIVASLETLLNLDAVDKLDPKKRISPPNRELFAQGVGNTLAGLIGAIPVTSVVIRGTVNVTAGATSKISAIFHGVLLLVCVVAIPRMLNSIPLASLAAILLVIGFKLASPAVFKEMWSQGRPQFRPFAITVVAIVMTDLLIGILIGLGIALAFILHSNLKRPIRRFVEKHIEGDVLHIELSNQVSFLNRAALESALREAPQGGSILLDARRTDYIDPDVLSLIREFRDATAPVYDINMRLVGFHERYRMKDSVQTIDFTPQEARDKLTPAQVIEILKAGNQRFVEGRPIDRDLRHGQDIDDRSLQPIVAVLTGIDSRTPVEMLFDLGLGDAYVIRVPGAVLGDRSTGGLEFAASVGGVRLLVVLGHADSSLLALAMKNGWSPSNEAATAGCQHLQSVLEELKHSFTESEASGFPEMSETDQQALLTTISRRHVNRTVKEIIDKSPVIKCRIQEGRISVVSALYDVHTGIVDFLVDDHS